MPDSIILFLLICYWLPILPFFLGVGVAWYLNPRIKAEVSRRFDQFNLESDSPRTSLQRVLFFQVVLLVVYLFYWISGLVMVGIDDPFSIALVSWLIMPLLLQSLFLYFNPKLYTVYSEDDSNFYMLGVLIGGLVFTLFFWWMVCDVLFAGIGNPNRLELAGAYILLCQVALTVFLLTIGRMIVYYFLRYKERRQS